MSFSNDVIGFYLQAEDQLSPKLDSVVTNYDRAIRQLTQLNKRMYREASSGFSALAELVEQLDNLPDALSSAYDKALKGFKRRLKPITQKVSIEFSASSQEQLTSGIKEAISDAIDGLKLRLSASLPERRSPLFNTKGLRDAYHKSPQPPDFVGEFSSAPHLAKGGIVRGEKGVDKIPAMLSDGEMVLPKDITKMFTDMAGGVLHSKAGKIASKSITEPLATAYDKVQNLIKEMDLLEAAAEAGLDPLANEKIALKLSQADVAMTDLRKNVQMFHGNTMLKIAPAIVGIQSQVGKFRKEVDQTLGPVEKLFAKLLGPARFLAISHAMNTLRDSTIELYHGFTDAFSTAGGEQLDDYVTNLNQINKTMHMSRSALKEFKQEGVRTAASVKGIGLTEMGEALQTVAEMKFPKDQIMEVARSVAVVSTASNIAKEDAAKLYDTMMNFGAMTREQADATTASIVRLSDEGFVSAEQMAQSTLDNVHKMGQFFAQSSKSDQQAMLLSLNKVSAMIPKGLEGSQDAIRDIFATAASGTLEGQQVAVNAFGMASEQVQEMLKQGRSDELLASLASAFSGKGALEATQLAESLGLIDANVPNLVGMSDSMGDILKKSKKLNDILVPTGKGLDMLSTMAKNNKTAFANFADSLVKTVAGLSVMGVSGLDVMNFLKEFNPVAILSSVYLGKMAYDLLFVGSAADGVARNASAARTGIDFMSKVGSKGIAALTAETSLLGLGFTWLAGAWATVQTALMSSLPAVAGMFGAVSLPIWAVVAAVVALVAVGVILWQKFGMTAKVFAFFGGVVDGLTTVLGELWTALSKELAPAMDVLWKVITPITDALGSLFTATDTSAESLASWANAGKMVGKVIGYIAIAISGLVIVPLLIVAKLIEGLAFVIDAICHPMRTANKIVHGLIGAFLALTSPVDAISDALSWLNTNVILPLCDSLTGHSLVPDLVWLAEVFDSVASLVSRVVNPALTMLLSPITMLSDAMGVLGSGVDFAFDRFDSLVSWATGSSVMGVLGKLSEVGGWMGGKITSLLSGPAVENLEPINSVMSGTQIKEATDWRTSQVANRDPLLETVEELKALVADVLVAVRENGAGPKPSTAMMGGGIRARISDDTQSIARGAF